jgi:hypothetical protein
MFFPLAIVIFAAYCLCLMHFFLSSCSIGALADVAHLLSFEDITTILRLLFEVILRDHQFCISNN